MAQIIVVTRRKELKGKSLFLSARATLKRLSRLPIISVY